MTHAQIRHTAFGSLHALYDEQGGRLAVAGRDLTSALEEAKRRGLEPTVECNCGGRSAKRAKDDGRAGEGRAGLNGDGHPPRRSSALGLDRRGARRAREGWVVCDEDR